MAGNVVRIADKVSCGDHSAQGSSDVFADNMPITHQGARKTTGHGCWLPTVFAGPWSKTVFVNNQPVALKGKTKIIPHKCGKKVHPGTASTGSPTVSIEK